jgi:2-polyprenyl-3-methyl-5-hydroxy-6-metoxy-1,4-benzoquinol methylase
MAASRIPDAGGLHPEAAAGAAFNGTVGHGVAEVILSEIARHDGVRTICDLGCGNGYLARRLAAQGFTVLGIDASPTYIEMAKASATGTRATFMTAVIDQDLAHQLRESHPQFDLVVSSDVIEHLYHPLGFLKAAHAILRPGGTAVIGTPYHGYWKNLAISLAGDWDRHHGVAWHGGHIKFFSPASLGEMLRDAGFNQPRFRYYGRVAGFWKNMIAIATRRDVDQLVE